jgi:hypothetical protein
MPVGMARHPPLFAPTPPDGKLLVLLACRDFNADLWDRPAGLGEEIVRGMAYQTPFLRHAA